MTKFRLISDLHSEGYTFDYQNCDEDVLILGGDIHTRMRHDSIFSQINPNTKVIFIPGNHEYYHGEFNDVNARLKEMESKYPNLKVLLNEFIEVDGIFIYGGTMFSDFLAYGDSYKKNAELHASTGINDFRAIKLCNNLKDRNWSIKDHKTEHEKFVKGLEFFLKESEGKKRLVISHFMPTLQVNDPQFRDSLLNPYFTANMERFMGLVDVWCCGHGHSSYNGEYEGTRLYLNPRGYGKENPKFDPLFSFEL